jgi:hypothetical protein
MDGFSLISMQGTVKCRQSQVLAPIIATALNGLARLFTFSAAVLGIISLQIWSSIPNLQGFGF